MLVYTECAPYWGIWVHTPRKCLEIKMLNSAFWSILINKMKETRYQSSYIIVLYSYIKDIGLEIKHQNIKIEDNKKSEACLS